MPPVTLRQIEIFIEIITEGNFRKCAQKLGITQVAISEHVSMFEQAIGGRLFDRNRGKPAELTPLGHQIHKHCRDILRSVDALVVLGNDRAPPESEWTLAVSAQGVLVQKMQDRLAELYRQFPGLTVAFDAQSYKPEVARERLDDGHVDISYVYSVGEPAPNAQFVQEQGVALFLSSSHSLAARSTIDVEDLKGLPILRLSRGNHIQVIMNDLLEQIGLGDAPSKLETDEWMLSLSSLSRGDGYAIMFDNFPRRILENFGLCRKEISSSLPKLLLSRLMSERAAASSNVRKIARMLDGYILSFEEEASDVMAA